MSDDDDGTGTTKLSVTVRDSTLAWLRERYPDAKSASERVTLAVSDARKVWYLLDRIGRSGGPPADDDRDDEDES
jgi:hypothetical protein